MPEDWKWRTVRLKAWMWDAIERLAKQENRDRSGQIRQLLTEALERRGVAPDTADKPNGE